MIKKLALAFFAIIIAGAQLNAQNEADAILGVWQNGEGTGHIKIEKIGTKYFGKIVWLKEPIDKETGKPKVDKKNPNAAMHNTPILGYRIIRDFVFQGDKKWEEGSIYDPKKGEDYKCKITMTSPNVLDVRGFVGISLIGRTDTWKRVDKPGGKVIK
jgi:uncharacterized protein (DUF2147 family)